MTLNRKEAQMMDRYVTATKAARAVLEPHFSGDHARLKREALIAIRDACGASAGLDDFYQDIIGETEANTP